MTSIRHLPLEIANHLCISEEFSEVDMKHMSGVLDHDVVIVSITDTQHVRGNTVASAGCHEIVHSL